MRTSNVAAAELAYGVAEEVLQVGRGRRRRAAEEGGQLGRDQEEQARGQFAQEEEGGLV